MAFKVLNTALTNVFFLTKGTIYIHSRILIWMFYIHFIYSSILWFIYLGLWIITLIWQKEGRNSSKSDPKIFKNSVCILYIFPWILTMANASKDWKEWCGFSPFNLKKKIPGCMVNERLWFVFWKVVVLKLIIWRNTWPSFLRWCSWIKKKIK